MGVHLPSPFAKVAPFSKVYMCAHIHCKGGLSLTHNKPFLWAHPFAKVISSFTKVHPFCKDSAMCSLSGTLGLGFHTDLDKLLGFLFGF